jgi:hypothetical protein
VEKTEEKIELTFKEMLIQEAWLVDVDFFPTSSLIVYAAVTSFVSTKFATF